MDFDSIGNAIALRFDRTTVTPPTSYRNIRISTANAPEQLPPTPCVIVFLADGNFESGPGTHKQSGHDWLVRFYFDQTTDLVRAQVGLRKWASVLVDRLRDSVQLGGLSGSGWVVTGAWVTGYTLGLLTYADRSYSGIELKVHVVVDEAWAAVA